MKKLARMIAVGLMVLPFAVLGGCCSKCCHKHKHHHHECADECKVEKMRYECGGK